ncbi:MAG: hypothetical protein CVU36_10390 [Betaproteobacteria bacterium HGW-Betaproteobacteria-9]|nr:MAG: hypothetical protein CVU36_10390 [Betaproteobacteria bacterium HGW-Betaproteobacteria-9]
MLPVLLLIGVAHAQPATELLRTDGIYRSEVQTNEDGASYISMLRFAPDGRVFLTHVGMPATQERVCAWFKPEREVQFWSKGAGYQLEADRLSFRTESPSATTLFDGTVKSGVLQMQLRVPTKQDLTYALTFKFAPCL